jgi:YVTN family beta-propeller protein
MSIRRLFAVLFFLATCVSPVKAATDTSDYVVCVSNEKSGDVSIIDGATQKVANTIAVGKRPRGIHASPDGRWLFVALSGSAISASRQRQSASGDETDGSKPADRSADGIAVIDLPARKLVRKINAGPDPEQFAVNPDGRKLYVANEDAGSVSVVKTDGALEATIPVPEEPKGVALSPDGNVVYVTCETRGTVVMIDTKTNKAVGQFIVGGRPRNVTFCPDGSKAFISSESSGTVHVYDCSERKLVEQVFLPENSRPMGLAMTRDGTRLYVTTGLAGTICVVDPGMARVLDTIRVGERPWGIGLSPDERMLYVANGSSDDVSAINAQTGKEVARIQTGTGPWGLEVVPINN